MEESENFSLNQKKLLRILADDAIALGLFFSSTTHVFYCYQPEGYYKILEQFEVEKIFLEALLAHCAKVNITDALVTSLVRLAQKYVRDFDPDTERYLSFSDCLLSLDDFTTTATPHIDRVALLHFPYKLSEVLVAEAPRWRQFLGEVLVTEHENDDGSSSYTPDPQLALLLQAVCGFFLTAPTINRPYAVFFVGPLAANGKSKITNILRALFTTKFISALSLEELINERFAMVGLIGKRLNLCAEEESKFLSGAKFKKIISGEPVKAEHKGGRSITFCPRTRFLFSTNEVPTFSGWNGGIKRRMVFLPFVRSFYGKDDDSHLEEKLMKELPGILNWMIQGAQFFISEDYKLPIEQTPAALEALSEFEQEVSSALRFIKEDYVPAKDDDLGSIYRSNSELHEEYKTWCERVGKKPMNSIDFGRHITPYTGKSRSKKVNSISVRVYILKKKKL